ncbi:diguanylate cyclase domain-containing protein [Kineococcus rhizosphaerae]|uniref:Diguanylate cyclase (GGDEF)-like protein n=1 Tax=Kineococcus rhizosphaerae TaxID=559628 RepID=A0A2T0R0B1_9ACTN|nr:diguanylate cyclase [Kineococcus rhizosphaerae]PRY12557.1 diguanylate cyclase (GGDEF)-like protein [Kineococcus rhizosphaerae]
MVSQVDRDHRPVVVVADFLGAYSLRLIPGVREVLQARGVPLLVHVHDFFTPGVSPLLRHAFADGGVRAAIVLPMSKAQSHDDVDRLLAAHPDVPAVALGAPTGQRPVVRADNRAGTAALVRHVAGQEGVRRIGLVRGVRHHVDSAEREAAVRETLAELGTRLDEALVVDGEFARDVTYDAVSALVRAGHRFDALIALNDEMALAAVDALHDHGLDVPGDVLVTGFDDDETPHPRCSLTTVSQQLHQQGRRAAELVLGLLDGTAAEDVLVETTLVRRSSTQRPVPGTTRVPPGPDVVPAGQATVTNAALDLNRAFMACSDERDVLRELGSRLARLQVSRCFVVLYEPVADDPAQQRLGRLALAHPGGVDALAAGDASLFPVADLLPAGVRHELGRGTLLLQPLGVRGHELGHVLYEQTSLLQHTAEVLRMDVSSALAAIARHRELEATVARRTEQLRREIGVRERAEADLREANAELRRSLRRDGLTGIANRSAFDEHLAWAWAHHLRDGDELSLLFVDVDCFKLYNDTRGHLRGDAALRAVARALEASVLAPGDLAARFGGEEFAVVLPATGPAGALVVAERVRHEVRRCAVEHPASPVVPWLTVSIGVATARPSASTGPRDLLAAADGAVYEAKAAGRNRAVLAAGNRPAR